MKNNITTRIIIAFFVSSLLLSCSKKNNSNIDFDFSTVKKSKKVNVKNNEKKFKNNPEDKLFIKELVPFETREEVQSKIKYGKKNPFSEGELELNELNSNLDLTGIVITKINKFAIVRYLDKEGTISQDSIGGLNTNLLPKGAKVINIDSQKMQLSINYQNENFVFKMKDSKFTK